MEARSKDQQQKTEVGRQKVLLVRDSSAQTTPPNSPSHHHHTRYRSHPGVTAGSKVTGGRATPEFRTVVNVFDERAHPNSSEMMTPGSVVMDTDSLQSTAAAADNGHRVFTEKHRRTNGPLSTANDTSYKGFIVFTFISTIVPGHYYVHVAFVWFIFLP